MDTLRQVNEQVYQGLDWTEQESITHIYAYKYNIFICISVNLLYNLPTIMCAINVQRIVMVIANAATLYMGLTGHCRRES